MSLWSELTSKHSYVSVNGGAFCIGIPTVNRKDLLVENLADLAVNTNKVNLDRVVIVDNGQQNIHDIVPPDLEDKTTIFTEKTNLGVSGSWNKMLDYCFKESVADHVTLVNDDVVLGIECLQAIEKAIIERPDVFVINGPYYWSCVTISRDCWNTIGKFDENFYPAYFEDNDYAQRLNCYKNHVDTDKIMYEVVPEIYPEVRRNSETIKIDPSFNQGYHTNAVYFQDKWGGNVHHPRYATPFNKGGEEPWRIK